jgi:uncharacterized cupredoxin-like copper-binding protein
MQATSEQARTNQWLGTAVALFIVIIAIILFGWVIGRMGLFNWVGSGETAVSPNTLQLTTEAMRFGQKELHVTAGQEVTLVLDNHDLYGHSFDVDALNVHIEMPPNGRTEIIFIPAETGTFAIYCNVPGHREAGMVSTLVVEE